jgi:hypothetical protein
MVVDFFYTTIGARLADQTMTLVDVYIGMIVALLIVLAATLVAHFCSARPLKPIRIAGAALVSDINLMVAACTELGKLNPDAATSCALLSRGLAAATTNAHPSVEESRQLYLGLASPTAISMAAAAYAAAAAANPVAPEAPLLQKCSERLRLVVKSIHRLGSALELE